MKKALILMLSVTTLIVASCKKSIVDDPQPETSKTEITINGTVYPTVKIGNQTWTTVNYNGNGGVNYNDGANDPRLGKLYSYPELKALTGIPTGWRIPTEQDAKTLMTFLGSSVNNTGSDWNGESFLNAEKSKKLTSTTTWNPTSLNGTNEFGLNIFPVGSYFPSSNPSVPAFAGKGTEGTFWLSNINSKNDALYFEISYFEWDTPVRQYPSGNRVLASYIVPTSAFTATFSEKRPLRFVKDN